MIVPKALVVAGDGINCERETAKAFELVGAKSKIMTLNDMIKNPSSCKNFQIFAFPGGFSFGDELGSGVVLALKIKHLLGDFLQFIIENDRLVIGICNGFQVLTKLGVIPDIEKRQRTLSLTFNNREDGTERRPFVNRWVKLCTPSLSSRCIWTQGLEREFMLPIRHGEGRVKLLVGREQEVFENLKGCGQIPLFYKGDVNGSFAKIAGLCDKTGRIFGLMPHPEAAMDSLLQPSNRKRGVGSGRKFFENAVRYFG